MSDLEFDPITLICEHDIDMAVTFLPAKNEVSRSKSSMLLSGNRETETEGDRY